MRIRKAGQDAGQTYSSDPSDSSTPAPRRRIRPISSAPSASNERQDYIPDDGDIAAAADSEAPVGYRNPPKHSRFRKGQSGNPAGRPRGAKGLKRLVRENLLAKVPIRTEAGTKRVTRIEAIILKQLEQAGKGNQRAAIQLMSLYDAAVPDQPETNRHEASEPLSDADEAILAMFRDEILRDKGD